MYFNFRNSALAICCAAGISAVGMADTSGELRFFGGARDGYAAAHIIGAHEAQHAGWYKGGCYDGTTSFSSRQDHERILSSWYLGGPRDGSACAEIVGLQNPLDRDTDGDGLPDWWELLHFGWITTAKPQDDADEDGCNNLFEFVADTDPWDPAAFFRIMSFQKDDAWRVSFTCSPTRAYSVEFVEDPCTSSWQQVEGAAGLPGEPSGWMSFSLTSTPGQCSFRVSVSTSP